RLSPRALENPESLFSFPGLARFLEEAARTQGIEDFGVRLGAASQPQQLGTFGRLIGQAFTLEEALDTAHRNYGNFSTGERPWLSRAGGVVHVHNRFVPAADDSWPQAAALALMLRLNLVRAAAGPAWRPTEVWVPVHNLPGCDIVPLL